jgi:hypothetical protein
MFIEIEELKTVVYQYEIEQITEADDDIIMMAILAATDESKSYIRGNNKKEWLDGRLQYDADATFNATGTARHALLLEMTKSIALWYVIRLCNVDIIYENVKERYDRATTWLTKVSKGEITLDLPTLDTTTTTRQPFSSGSRKKFNHE